MIEKARCRICGRPRPLTDYYTTRVGGRIYRRLECKSCTRAIERGRKAERRAYAEARAALGRAI